MSFDVVLDHDLTCSGDGFSIEANNVTLDLNGHTLAGRGLPLCTAVPFAPPRCSLDSFTKGVRVDGRSGVTIKNGTITGFGYGIRLVTSDAVTLSQLNVLQSSADGVSFLDGSTGNALHDSRIEGAGLAAVKINNGGRANTIERTSIRAGGSNGISIGEGAGNAVYGASSANEILNNVVEDTRDGSAILIYGSSSNTVRGNTIRHNSVGRQLPSPAVSLNNGSSDNLVAANTITENGGQAVYVRGLFSTFSGANGVGLIKAASNNRIEGNVAERNQFGITLAPGSNGNQILGNTVTATRGTGITAGPNLPQPVANVFSNNTSVGNGTDCVVSPRLCTSATGTPLDAHDNFDSTVEGTGVRNTWTGNSCVNASPAGLCAGARRSPPTFSVAATIDNLGALAAVRGGRATPTGSVGFFLCGPGLPAAVAPSGGCPTGGALIGGPVTLFGSLGSSVATVATQQPAGRYCWRAEYTGDAVYAPATYSDSAAACFIAKTDRVAPAFAATLRDATKAMVTTAPTGSAVHATAIVSGGAGQPVPTGTQPSTCSARRRTRADALANCS